MNWRCTPFYQIALALLASHLAACQPIVVMDNPDEESETEAPEVDRRDPPSDWIADWTLLIYAAGDDLDPNLVAAFDQDALEWQHGLGGSALFRVMVQRDYAPFQWDEQDNPRPSERYAIYREERHHPAYPPTEDAPEVLLLGETDTSSSTTLRDFLVYGIRTFPARHYWVTFTGHGDGFAGLADDATTGYGKRLSIDGLASALTEASAVIASEIRTLPGYGGPDTSNRIDVVAFDACRLASVEVASSIADAADYMIASQESVPYAGHPYSSLRYIAQDLPDSSPRALVEAVVTDYVRAYVEGVSTAGRAYVGTSVTSVGIDLRRIGGLESALNQLATAVEHSRPKGFSCAEVKALLEEACDQAHLSTPNADVGIRPTGNTPAAESSVDLIALLERLAQNPSCHASAETNQSVDDEIVMAARRALALIGRPPLPSPHDEELEYGGQYRKIADFGPASPFVVEAQRVDPGTGIRLGGLGILWGNPYDLLFEQDGSSLFDTYRGLPFESQTRWTRMLRGCIDEAKACRSYVPAPNEPVEEGPCANF